MRGNVVTHFVKVTSMGRFRSPCSCAMARDTGSSITIAPTNEVTRLRVRVVLIRLLCLTVRVGVP